MEASFSSCGHEILHTIHGLKIIIGMIIMYEPKDLGINAETHKINLIQEAVDRFIEDNFILSKDLDSYFPCQECCSPGHFDQ